MNILVGSGRRGRLAISLALIVSNTHILLFVGSIRSTAALAAQRPPASTPNYRSVGPNDKSSTRLRPAEAQPEVFQKPSARGPIIRVALMTDVSSIALSSSSGFIVRRSATEDDGAKNVPNGSLNVELRQVSEPAALHTSAATYRVGVGSSTESRSARKLLDELKKEFFEPVAMTFDEKQKEYSVLIGQFPNRSEATRLLERLRKAGYENLRIVSDQKATGTQAVESLTDTNARAAKYKAQPTSTARSSVKPDRRSTQLVALAGDKLAAASEDELVISPAGYAQQLDRSKQSAGSQGNDRNSRQVTGRDQSGTERESRISAAPAVVRIGKTDYRGEINLVLNPRGRINVVNALPLEDYLRGVVPMELSPGVFPEIEALKAQAVAARSYALAHLGQHSDEGFDLVDDTRAQVYGGLSAERELTNRAIDETRGIAAVFTNAEGKLVPIEALYTANCGGRTENNDEVFGGKPVPYLRAVACSPDRQSFAGRDIASGRTPEPFIGADGRSIAREVGLLSVLGFSIPRRVTGSYLNRSPDPDEVAGWIEQTARLTQRERPGFARGEGTRLAEFARLVAVSVYGEGRASTLLAPADVDYLLSGLRVQALPREARADIAMLLRDGILRAPAAAELDGRAPISRGQAIETLARAISMGQPASLKSQPSDPNSQVVNSRFKVSDFRSEIAAPSENGRLIIASGPTQDSLARDKGSRFTSLNTGATGRLGGPRQDEPINGKPANDGKGQTRTPPGLPLEGTQRERRQNGLEISEGAWLFRILGGESYQVDRLSLMGGERVVYHLNAKGRVDFLEASISGRTASSDRFSNVAQWQERIPADDLRQRLARVRIDVGRLEKIEPVSFSSSNRVTEVEVTGDESRVRLRRSQIRAALGLKEYLFVVDRETDARGQVVAFVFTGRGWGHGVGMCQTGAYGLAKEGYSYTAIIQKYYTGVKLQQLY